MTKLTITKFGNPILRRTARRLSTEEIQSERVQQLIADIRHHLTSDPKYGVGLAAPQVGVDMALSVIEIKPTPYRPESIRASLVIINPEIVETYGRRSQMWEGCMSYGTSTVDFPYAKALRYKKIRLRYKDEQGKQQEQDFDGLLAHVIQHETDHLNGVLFVDRVKDTTTYCMKSEFMKNVLRKGKA